MATTRNPLQEQLLKAGLAKKSRVDQIARDQARQRQSKAVPTPNAELADAERARLGKVERDRALSAQRNAEARAQEQRAQIRQIIDSHRLAPGGEADYRFIADGAIRSIPVTVEMRRQLASGALAIVRHEPGYAIVPRAAAEKIEARDASLVVLDHRRTAAPTSDADDEFYARFKVPDDLSW